MSCVLNDEDEVAKAVVFANEGEVLVLEDYSL